MEKAKFAFYTELEVSGWTGVISSSELCTKRFAAAASKTMAAASPAARGRGQQYVAKSAQNHRRTRL